jgi:hypothetical protein
MYANIQQLKTRLIILLLSQEVIYPMEKSLIVNTTPHDGDGEEKDDYFSPEVLLL